MDTSQVILALVVCVGIGWFLYDRINKRSQRAEAELREELETQKKEQARLKRQLEVLTDPKKYRREMKKLRDKAEIVSEARKAFTPIFDDTLLFAYKHPEYRTHLISVAKKLPDIGDRYKEFVARYGLHLDDESFKGLDKNALRCWDYQYDDDKDLKEAESIVSKIQHYNWALQQYEAKVWVAVEARQAE